MHILFKHTDPETGNLHREFTQRQAQAILLGEAFLELCECKDCIKEREVKANMSMDEICYAISDKITYESLGIDGKYLVNSKAEPWKFSDNFRGDIFG